MTELLNEILESNAFLKDPLEDFFGSISMDFNNLTKYVVLFKDNGFEKAGEYYEKQIGDLYDLVLLRFKHFIENYYKEKIENIYSRVNESLSWAEDTGEIVETVKTVYIVETENEMGEESLKNL